MAGRAASTEESASTLVFCLRDLSETETCHSVLF